MSIFSEKTFLTGQYQNSANLDARVALHTRFSENKTGWFGWVFDQFSLPAQAAILELGCGSGELWRINQERIPAGWELTLSDFSAGMAAQVQQKLVDTQQVRQVLMINAQAIPFPNGQFEAVIANHMLYHVPDRPGALGEIRRVLKTNGCLYAATVGERHVAEIHELTSEFDPELARQYNWGTNGFTLENGAEQLMPYFSQIQEFHYPDRLLVTEAEPLADYILSCTSIGLDRQRKQDLIDFILVRLRKSGVIEITKDQGLFIAS